MHFTKDVRNRLKKQLCLLAAIALMPSPCCSSPESPEFMCDVEVELSREDFRTQPNYSGRVYLRIGGELTVILCSNPSTGFSWPESAQISDQAVLVQIDHKWLPPANDLIGADNQQVWTFETLNVGSSTIYLEYSQSWESGIKAVWTFRLTVVVKGSC